jgi:putative restriction endonuclease
MTKAVFIASSHSAYQDRPGEVYHFPNIYLTRVAQTVGDWVIFFEGRRGGSRGYYAVQRVARIETDPSDPTHSFAILDRASELSFETLVPRLREGQMPYETGLPLSRGSNTSAVRLISEADFAAIVSAGLQAVDDAEGLSRLGGPEELRGYVPEPGRGMFDAQEQFAMPNHDDDRPMVLSSRAFRDRTFARQVKRAYGGRCAMSGLSLRNGGGRAEVEAAHILPVKENGPDTVRNGLALSGTVHWMFDRGLVAVDSDGTILAARGSIAAEVADRLLTPDRRLIVPQDPVLRPHAGYLQWHRLHRFKG